MPTLISIGHRTGPPLAPRCYAISLLYCTTVSLAEDGAALGALWGTELAARMLARAGSADVTVLDSPRTQNCRFVCRPGAAPDYPDGRWPSS